MNPANRNAGAVSRPTPAQNTCGVSELHNVKVAQLSPWGTSSVGLAFPNPSTCKGQLLAELLSRASVSHRTFDSQVRTMRAALYIKRLRDDGWPITTTLVPGENKYEKTRYAVYQLAPSVPIREPERVFMALCELAAMGVL